MYCNNCLHCSLDAVYCHLNHRTTEPTSTCRNHTDCGNAVSELRSMVSNKCKKISN